MRIETFPIIFMHCVPSVERARVCANRGQSCCAPALRGHRRALARFIERDAICPNETWRGHIRALQPLGQPRSGAHQLSVALRTHPVELLRAPRHYIYYIRAKVYLIVDHKLVFAQATDISRTQKKHRAGCAQHQRHNALERRPRKSSVSSNLAAVVSFFFMNIRRVHS